ncbi:hypothetical protein [Methylocapsa sp. S129]|uniref:hypothetical protein n=1 Tax=Methylocapsa sp. S129 TaxID=1641869 RepID=UPI00131CD544|nr:hypothetical protein [Methylocapsa sp. S129]
MSLPHRIGRSLAALALAGATILAASTAQAAMAPAPVSVYAASDIESAGCLLGAHVGPLGACVGGYHHDRHCWVNRWGHRVCN